jgi:hypothetical protein
MLRSTPQFRNFFFREIDMRPYLYLLALVFPIITACATNRGIPEPATRFVSVDAQRLLIESAEAHGLQAYGLGIGDLTRPRPLQAYWRHQWPATISTTFSTSRNSL